MITETHYHDKFYPFFGSFRLSRLLPRIYCINANIILYVWTRWPKGVRKENKFCRVRYFYRRRNTKYTTKFTGLVIVA